MIPPLAAVVLLLAQAPPPGTTSPAPEATPAPFSGPVVVLETSLGRIKIGLDKQKAPVSVDNFIRYVRAGHYDGTIFHRVIKGFMVQGGGLEPDMAERRSTLRSPIRNEAANGLRNRRGTVAMARTSEPDSATAQFFINLVDNAFLDRQADKGPRGAGYAVFGEVLEGMDIVDRIADVRTTTKGGFENVPVAAVVIKRARELSASRPKPAAPRKPSP